MVGVGHHTGKGTLEDSPGRLRGNCQRAGDVVAGRRRGAVLGSQTIFLLSSVTWARFRGRISLSLLWANNICEGIIPHEQKA